MKDISFEVQRGQVLGIIGRNGAGKSTLLKILSRVTDPTEGLGEIHGRVGSLLEVGTGFHPELTGRENIYLNGAILGMKRSEIERKFDEIVDFSEVEQFIDTPVKRYSSGMYLRLAFAVAAHLEPEILVVDEVLAVGDAEFQRKCLGKMSDVAQQGRTVLFVSHNMSAILRLTAGDAGDREGPAGDARAHPRRRWITTCRRVTRRRASAPGMPTKFPPMRRRSARWRCGCSTRSGKVVDAVRSIEPFHIEMEYQLDAPITGLAGGDLPDEHARGVSFSPPSIPMTLSAYEQHPARASRALPQPLHDPGGFAERRALCGGGQCQLVPRPALFPGRAGAQLLRSMRPARRACTGPSRAWVRFDRVWIGKLRWSNDESSRKTGH